ncbi:MAG: ribose-5-phosphate isomerase RpiA [Bauldia sp.]
MLSKAPGDDALRLRAAEAALAVVEPGMKLGLGTGRTADHFVRLLGARVRAGLEILGVPTSERTAALAVREGISLTTLDEHPALDLTVDGADEIDSERRLIKGGGGALLREKIVASASARMLVVVDEAKLVKTLGAFPLPIELVTFGLAATTRAIEKAASRLGLAGALQTRMDGVRPFLTDGGHVIVDASFGRIPDPEALAAALRGIPGVVEHGLFIGLASAAIVARGDRVDWF